ncbi:MFS transporter [Pelagicoccus sp. SDUM812005]|uniref:MFS transporter n=1 Tax=Pelagicoccus sp. SDUM812005 TaxID=3041257 RepID=UPI00281019A7|nr:MFS transporter [Pelagicoccus sp. SDUM812005]MDQ8183341.1 MFS transporter [Pelagicoccus sp. SDUM812005]
MVEKLGFASGDLASCLYFGVFMNFLPIFYTDVFGLSAAALGTMILVTRTWDWINDPIMGMIADRTKSRMGKFRPWLLWVLPFWAILGVLTFTTFDLSPTGKLIYAYSTYTLLMMAYTAINVPYSALMGVMTPRSDQRTILSSFRFLGAFAGVFIVSTTLQHLVKFFGDGDEQFGYTATIAVFATASSLLFITTFVTTKERVAPPKNQKSSILKDLGAAAKNGPWRALILISVMTILWIAIRGGATIHFFKYVSGNELWGGTFLAVGSAVQLVGVMLTKQFTQVFGGKKKTFISVTLINAVFLFTFYFIPTDNFYLIMGHQAISAFMTAPLMALFWSMIADSADYGQWKLGQRTTGLIFSTGTSSMKIGWSIGPAISMYLLTYFGYQANVDQSPETVEGLKLIMSFIPAGVAVLAAGSVLFYRIDAKMEKEMEAAIAAEAKADAEMPTC